MGICTMSALQSAGSGGNHGAIKANGYDMTPGWQKKLTNITGQDRVLLVATGENSGNLGGQVSDDAVMDAGMMSVHLRALTAESLRHAAPHLVVCALFAPLDRPNDGDAVAVILRLQSLGYFGRIAVIAPPLPNHDLVQSELRALGRGAEVTLIVAL